MQPDPDVIIDDNEDAEFHEDDEGVVRAIRPLREAIEPSPVPSVKAGRAVAVTANPQSSASKRHPACNGALYKQQVQRTRPPIRMILNMQRKG